MDFIFLTLCKELKKMYDLELHMYDDGLRIKVSQKKKTLRVKVSKLYKIHCLVPSWSIYSVWTLLLSTFSRFTLLSPPSYIHACAIPIILIQTIQFNKLYIFFYHSSINFGPEMKHFPSFP